MSERKKVFTNFQYPFPAEPSKWDLEERRFAQGIKQLFDILFAKKVQNVLIADDAITSRNIKDESIGLRHLANGFGSALDISGNEMVGLLTNGIEAAQETADEAVESAADAQHAADNAQETADEAVESAADAQHTADDAASAAATAQRTADNIPNSLYPVGIIVLGNSAPGYGSWTQVDIGLEDIKAWKRTA